MSIVPINVQKIGIFGKWQKLIHCAADNKLLSTKLIIFVKNFRSWCSNSYVTDFSYCRSCYYYARKVLELKFVY